MGNHVPKHRIRKNLPNHQPVYLIVEYFSLQPKNKYQAETPSMPREKLVPFLTRVKSAWELKTNMMTCHARTTPPKTWQWNHKPIGKLVIFHCHVSLFWSVRLYSSILHCDQPSCIFMIRKYSFKSQKSRQKCRPIFTHISWESKGTLPNATPPPRNKALIRPY